MNELVNSYLNHLKQKADNQQQKKNGSDIEELYNNNYNYNSNNNYNDSDFGGTESVNLNNWNEKNNNNKKYKNNSGGQIQSQTTQFGRKSTTKTSSNKR